MDTLQKTLSRHLSQVATDRVFRDAHGLAYILGNHLAVLFEDGEDLLLAVSGQHSCSLYIILDIARNCTILSVLCSTRIQLCKTECGIHKVETLSDDWYVLKKTTFDLLRNDGTWQRQSRETYDRGNGATILLYNLARRTVILTRQFRFPVFVNGHPGLLVEAAAGLLDDVSPEERIKAEVEEETGYRIARVQKIFEAYMSPGSVTEKLHFFVAEYDSDSKVAGGAAILRRVRISR